MSDELDKILDSGSLEDIDKILSALDEGADESAALAAVESGDTGEANASAADHTPGQSDKPAAPDDKQDDPPQEPDEAEPPVILAKDGKNQIPYSVLENERQQAAALKAQLEELNRKNALLEQQLTDADIKPKELPEKVRFTPEQLSELESYGEIGEAVAVLAQQNAALLERLQAENIQPSAGATESPSNPLAENPDTLRWAENDAHWGVVETVNAALDADPKWAGQSLEQRIPEIVRRTKAALGEPGSPMPGDVAAAAAEAVSRSQRAAPNSLTDVGGEVPGQTKSLIEQLEEADPSDIEAFLAEQTAKGKSVDEVLSSLLV